MQTVLPDFTLPREPEGGTDRLQVQRPVSGFLPVHDITVPYRIDYHKRWRSNSVWYYPNGDLEVRAMADATFEDIIRTLMDHSEWIYQKALQYDPRYQKKDEEDTLLIGDQQVVYRITYSTRVRRMTIKITAMKQVIVLVPYNEDHDVVKEFVNASSGWIARHIGIPETIQGETGRYIEAGGRIIPYSIRVSERAKRIILKILPDTSVVLVTPRGVHPDKAHGFVIEKSDWIVKRLNDESRLPVPSRQFQDGEPFLVLGREVLLSVIPDRPHLDIRLTDEHLVIHVPSGIPDSVRHNYIRKIIEQFLKQTLDGISSEMVRIWASRLGIQAPSVTYKNQKTRWGVCTGHGIILNIRLAMAPLEIIEYVVVHELCHIRQHNHSRAFWGLVGQMLPDYQERRSRLKRDGVLYSL